MILNLPIDSSNLQLTQYVRTVVHNSNAASARISGRIEILAISQDCLPASNAKYSAEKEYKSTNNSNPEQKVSIWSTRTLHDYQLSFSYKLQYLFSVSSSIAFLIDRLEWYQAMELPVAL